MPQINKTAQSTLELYPAMLSFKASCTIYAIRCLIFQTLFSFLFIFSPFSPCLLVSRQQQDCRKHTRSVLFPLSMPQQQCVALPMTSFWPRSQCLSHFTSREEHQARHPEMVLAGGEQHRQGASASGGMKLNICIYFLPLVVTAISLGILQDTCKEVATYLELCKIQRAGCSPPSLYAQPLRSAPPGLLSPDPLHHLQMSICR